jgi:hypothetical protein
MGRRRIMDGRLALAAVAFAALLAFTVFLTAAVLEGVLEHTARALERCTPPCPIGPPPESPERQAAKWLLAAAVAALEVALIARSGRGCAVDPAAAGAQRSPARSPSSALSFSASSRACSLCAPKLRRDRRQG